MNTPWSAEAGRMLRLVRKELSESLRDRRTILTLVLMPVLLYPLLVIAFQQFALSGRPAADPPDLIYRVGFVSVGEERAMLDYWVQGHGHSAPPWEDEAALAKYIAADLKLKPFGPELLGEAREQFVGRRLGIGTAVFPRHAERVPAGVPTAEVPDLETAVRLGLVDVGLVLEPPGRFRADPRRRLHVAAILLARENSTQSRDAVHQVERLTNRSNVLLVTEGMRLVGIPQRADPVQITGRQVPNEVKPRSDLVPVLVPLILLLMTMTGAVYPAIDLTAGERERGTLEVLVAAPIPRLAVLFAKYVAVLAVALLTALINLGMMALTLSVTGLGRQLFADSFAPGVLVQVLALLVLFAAFFSAVLLTLTSFARSFKEAQAYLIPLMLFSLLPGMLALMPGLSLRGPLAVVPLLNIVLLARDLLSGQASAAVTAVVVLSTLVYAVGAVAVAARVFGTEAVLSSEQSGWGDLLRRPARGSERMPASPALLCLALMFPVAFLLVYGVAGMRGLPLAQRLAWAAAGNAVVFALLPLLFLWRARVPLSSGLRLRRPPLLAWPVAALLGVSLWPWVNEVVVLLRQAGVASLGEEFLARSRETLAQWREVSPLLILAALAVLPAVLEELFFRGFLFGALLGEHGRKRRTAVVATAALFAAFHIFVPGGLAVERLLASFLMGLVLGALALRSDSVLPGVVLHLLHNGILTLAAYYQPLLIDAGWLAAEQEHLPAWLLGASGAAAALGLAGLWWLGRARSDSVPE